MFARVGDQSGEALHEGERLEDEGARSVAPGPPERPLDLAITADLEATLREGGAGDVADERFEAMFVGAVDAGRGVEREALAVGGQVGGVGKALVARH